jgi:hypothetical protein
MSMKIPLATLLSQAEKAVERWPWIPATEDSHHLPRWLLLAVGSRETNLNAAFTEGKTGDGGHGHGVWQYDDRFHEIPAGFDTNPQLQADIAAKMLAALIAHFPGNMQAAMAAYNAGVGGVERKLRNHQSADDATTGRDYGSDVLARLEALQEHLTVVVDLTKEAHEPTKPLEVWAEMIATDPVTGDYWVLTGPEGRVEAYNANGTRGTRFFGDLTEHPEFNAGPGTPNGGAVSIVFSAVAGANPGYVIYTRDPQGGVHPYRFDATTVAGTVVVSTVTVVHT